MSQDDNALYFVPLGGSGEIGMNLNLYGFGPEEDRKWIIVDCGVTFGDLTSMSWQLAKHAKPPLKRPKPSTPA